MLDRKASALAVGALLVTASIVVASPGFAAQPTCFGKRATIVGQEGDVVEGTPKDDVIVALKGVISVESFGGDDLICARGGDDYIKAGGGEDKIRTGENLDTVHGGDGPDHIWGERGSDSLSGGRGADRIFGGLERQDQLLGGPGDDLLHGGDGYDMAEFWGSSSAIKANLTKGSAVGEGKDELVSIEGLVGSKYDDVLRGNELSNHLIGELGDDEIYALGSSLDGGSDILRSVGGEDLLNGGPGPDTVSYHLSPVAVQADLETGEATSEGLGHDTLIGIENLTGSKENDSLSGDDGDNVLIGDWGEDKLDGRRGRDEVAYYDAVGSVTASLLEGTASSPSFGSEPWVDSLRGIEDIAGSGYADSLTGDDGPNLLWGGSRADTLSGLGDNDVLIGHNGTDTADGGDGSADQCDAETESNCEEEPSQMIAASVSSPWREL